MASESAKKLEESYYEEMLHFLPSLVDISAVTSPIISVAGGNQHSMILSGKPDEFIFCYLLLSFPNEAKNIFY